MEFLATSYLIFLPLAATLYYLLPAKLRCGYLVVVSIAFYVMFEPSLFYVLPGYIAVGYLGGLAMQKGRVALILTATVTAAVAVLCFFKYRYLFMPEDITIITPVGISYYTFSTIGYLVDVATGANKPEKNLLRYSLFIGFFAQLSAGPIPRSDTLLPQLSNPLTFNYQKTAEGVFILAVGYLKKLCVAIPLGNIISPIFKDSSSGGAVLFVACLLFTLQLYFDFSGYTDIARGTAQIFGITLAPNFKQPFYSTNFSGFWQRWHISLSRWLQDYIFTPLVWNRPLSKIPVIGSFFTGMPLYSTIFILFVISGLWHGAGLTFLIWGILQAVFRIGEELLHRYYRKPPKKQGAIRLLAKRAVVFLLFSASLVFFRSADMAQALSIFGRIFTIADINFAGFFTAATTFNADPLIAAAYLLFCIVSLAVVLLLDNQCFNKKCTEVEFICTLRYRWVIYYLIIGLCFAGFLLNNGGFGSSASFIYAGF